MLPIYSVSETSVLYGQDLWNTHSYDVKNHFAEMRTITDFKTICDVCNRYGYLFEICAYCKGHGDDT